MNYYKVLLREIDDNTDTIISKAKNMTKSDLEYFILANLCNLKIEDILYNIESKKDKKKLYLELLKNKISISGNDDCKPISKNIKELYYIFKEIESLLWYLEDNCKNAKNSFEDFDIYYKEINKYQVKYGCHKLINYILDWFGEECINKEYSLATGYLSMGYITETMLPKYFENKLCYKYFYYNKEVAIKIFNNFLNNRLLLEEDFNKLVELIDVNNNDEDDYDEDDYCD